MKQTELTQQALDDIPKSKFWGTTWGFLAIATLSVAAAAALSFLPRTTLISETTSSAGSIVNVVAFTLLLYRDRLQLGFDRLLPFGQSILENLSKVNVRPYSAFKITPYHPFLSLIHI